LSIRRHVRGTLRSARRDAHSDDCVTKATGGKGSANRQQVSAYVKNVWECDNLEGVAVRRLRGGQRGKFVFYALLMKIFKNAR